MFAILNSEENRRSGMGCDAFVVAGLWFFLKYDTVISKNIVMRGLDPRIHVFFSGRFGSLRRGQPGQARS